MKFKNHLLMYMPVLVMLFFAISIYSQDNDNNNNDRDTESTDTLRTGDEDSLRLGPDTTGIKGTDTLDRRDSLDIRRDSVDLRDPDNDNMQRNKNEGDLDNDDNDIKKDNNLDDGFNLYDKNNKIRYLFYIPSFRNSLYENKTLIIELFSEKTNLL